MALVVRWRRVRVLLSAPPSLSLPLPLPLPALLRPLAPASRQVAAVAVAVVEEVLLLLLVLLVLVVEEEALLLVLLVLVLVLVVVVLHLHLRPPVSLAVLPLQRVSQPPPRQQLWIHQQPPARGCRHDQCPSSAQPRTRRRTCQKTDRRLCPPPTIGLGGVAGTAQLPP